MPRKRLGLIIHSRSELSFYIVAEKILAPFEKIPSAWAIHGTVGYEFLNNITHLLYK